MCGPRCRAAVRLYQGITSLFMPLRWGVPAGKTVKRTDRMTVFQGQHVALLALAKLLCVLPWMACNSDESKGYATPSASIMATSSEEMVCRTHCLMMRLYGHNESGLLAPPRSHRLHDLA